MWKLFLPLLFGVNMVHYWLITPDGSKFLLESPKWNVELHVPDGFDLPPLSHDTQSVYKQPGLQLKGVKVGARQVNLMLNLNAVSRDELHDLRSTIWRYVRWNTTSNDSPPDPLILRYENSGRQTDLFAYLLSENVTNLGDGADVPQAASVNLIAYDPFWYKVQATSPAWDDTDTLKTASLSLSQTLTFSRIAGKESGVWNTFGAGVDATVFAICFAPDGTMYVGGQFANADGHAIALVAKWNGTTFEQLGAGITGTTVYAMACDASGNLYVAGNLTTANVKKWNGAAWSNIGASDAFVYALAFDAWGNLYAGGGFSTIGGVAINRLAKWNGSAWSALGVGDIPSGIVYSLAYSPSGTLLAGGSFTTAGGQTVNRLAAYTITSSSIAFGLIGSGTNGDVYAVAVDSATGRFYIGGNFTTINGIAANYVASWDGGRNYAALGTGTNGIVRALDVYSNTVTVGGFFSSAGGVTLNNRIAQWNGYAWNHLDVTLPGAATTYCVKTNGYNLYLGFDTTGSGTASKNTAVINAGDYDAFPIFTLTGPGTFQWIENASTHKRILLNLSLQAGETATIDLTPGNKSIVSSLRGNLLPYSTLLPISDFASFALSPDPLVASGSNTLDAYVTDTTGASAIQIQYREPFLSADHAVTP